MFSTVEIKNYICAICKESFVEHSRFCEKCGGVFTIVKVHPSMIKSLPKKKKVASQILADKVKVKTIAGFEFLGEMPKKFNLMLFGKPGSGKSYFTLCFADTLAKMKKKKTIYFTAEEDIGNRDLQKKLIDCKISDHLLIESIKTKKQFYDLLEKEYGYNTNIFVDSISKLRLTPKEVEHLSSKIKGVFIFVIHINKKGDYKGTTEYEHDTQVVIEVSEGVATTGKNRLGTSGGEYHIFESINNDQ